MDHYQDSAELQLCCSRDTSKAGRASAPKAWIWRPKINRSVSASYRAVVLLSAGCGSRRRYGGCWIRESPGRGSRVGVVVVGSPCGLVQELLPLTGTLRGWRTWSKPRTVNCYLSARSCVLPEGRPGRAEWTGLGGPTRWSVWLEDGNKTSSHSPDQCAPVQTGVETIRAPVPTARFMKWLGCLKQGSIASVVPWEHLIPEEEP